jgi:tetratricopeptide (TPR) repeat protein
MVFLTGLKERLLTASAILVGGTVCGGPLGAIAASVAGGIVSPDLVTAHMNNIGVRLHRSGDQLGNHDLTAATGLAIALIIKSIGEAGTYPASTKKLTALAKYTLRAWQEIAQNIKQAEETNFDPIQEANIVELFQKGTADYVGQKVLTADDWQYLLKNWLCPGAKVELLDHVLSEVAGQLRDKFAFALREVLKADFETGGKAFAGLTLSLLGEMRGILQELLESRGEVQGQLLTAELTADLTAQLTVVTELRQELEGNTQRFKELGLQINSGFEAVLRELGLTQANITRMREELLEELRQLQAGLAKVSEQNEKIQETVDTGFAQSSQENQKIQETVDQGFERVIGYLEREKPQIQAISFSLDTSPPTVTNFQGRVEELKTVNGWLDDENNKLGVIVGMGGMGKSTLAAKVFRQRTDFQDKDKLWLDLGQRPSYSIVAREILRLLGQYSQVDLEAIEEACLTNVLINCLQRQRFLLVWDNLESVIGDEGYGEFLRRWLGKCHQTEILVTTQVVPELLQGKPTELDLPGLLVEDGVNFLKDLHITGNNTELEAFVQRVNGHPLTLKLAAGLLTDEFGKGTKISKLADLGLLEVSELMCRLEGEHREAVVQLVAVLDASFQRLSERWQRILSAVVVLRQVFNTEMVTALVEEEIREKDLRGLAQRGFLVAETAGYRLQPFIADYLKFRLGDLREAHLQAIAFYESRYKDRSQWQTVQDVQEYLEVFYHLCELGEYEAAFDVIWDKDDVNNFLDLRGKNQLRVKLYHQLIANLTDQQDCRYRLSLMNLGNAYHSLGQYTEAITFLEQSLVIYREIQDKQGEANCLMNLGNANYSLEHYPEAIALYQQALSIQREIQDRQGEANCLMNLGNVNYSLEHYPEAISLYQQALSIQREIQDRQGEANCLMNLGNVNYSLEHYPEAISLYQQALAIQREIQDRQGEANSLGNLGNANYSLGIYPEAITFYQKALEIYREIHDRRSEARTLSNLSFVYNKAGRIREGIEASQQAMFLHQELNLPLDVYPIPHWTKKLVKFSQHSKFHLVLCFIGGVFAFPFALIWLIIIILYRLIYQLFKRR